MTWKLKKNVAWHDGKPFTADDVVATWEWAADPASAAVTSGAYKDIARIDKLDSHTAKITFKRPAPFPFEPFCGPTGRSCRSTSSSRSRARSPARRRPT